MYASVRSWAAGLALILGVMTTAIWAVTGAGYLWPAWVWFGLAGPLVAEGCIRRALAVASRRSLTVHAVVAALLAASCVLIWLLSRRGYFWPFWPMLALGATVAVHALVAPLFSTPRERALAQRVGALTESRRSALEIQEAELRRVERDLHDGAQARLVSLGMSLGLAEHVIDEDAAQARRLLAEARLSAGAALGDLRDLVRGIHPPVLADRGLDGGLRALLLTVPVPVELRVDLPERRLPPPVESAVYFAVAEAIANVVKHSDAAAAWVTAVHDGGRLSVVVGDDGHGGADPDRGTGLRGIERRLSAFDGTLSVVSPPSGPTVVRMEVPCELSSPRTTPS